MKGNVKRSKVRRPNLSIVQMAGRAKVVFTKPKPREDKSVERVLSPASLKMVDE